MRCWMARSAFRGCRSGRTRACGYYLSCRKGDKRFRAVSAEPALYQGEVFYITCIGEQDALSPLYNAVRGDTRFSVTFQQELYREEYWLEIMPARATKAHGIRKLCALLGFDRVCPSATRSTILGCSNGQMNVMRWKTPCRN